MFNWQDLDRSDIIHWMIPHLLAQHRDDEVFQQISEATDHFTNVDLKLVINGHEFDGEVALRELFTRMDASFDRAVASKASELTQFAEVQDLLTEVLEDAQGRIRTKLDDLGFPSTPDY